ncbi:GntR family transcriptional regulator [Enterococcus sp. LJL120]
MNKYGYEEKLLEKIDFTQRKPLAEVVYLGLKEAILDGTFPLGERINENSLAVQLSISRTPIRKALNRLIEEDLVDHVYDYGTFVKSVNLDKIREIYKIRKSLEVLLYDEVARKANAADLVFLKKSVQKMLELEDQNQTDALNLELNDFNQRINEIAQMTTLTSILSDLHTYFRNFRSFSFDTRERRKIATKEHQILVQLIEAKEADYLKRAVEQHISHAEMAAIQFFDSRELKAEMLKGNFYQPKKSAYCAPDCPILTEEAAEQGGLAAT